MPVTPDDDPVVLLQRWYHDAQRRLGEQGDAIVLATASAAGVPSARVVLCRNIDDDDGSLTFYTSYSSRKGIELAENPHASAVFFWWALDRQVRVEGKVEPAPAEVSDAYWAGRPRESQLSAWASPQSAPVRDRQELLRRVEEARARFDGVPVPRPRHWGGFVLRPHAIEFWSRGEGRLHERVRFERAADRWRASILGP